VSIAQWLTHDFLNGRRCVVGEEVFRISDSWIGWRETSVTCFYWRDVCSRLRERDEKTHAVNGWLSRRLCLRHNTLKTKAAVFITVV